MRLVFGFLTTLLFSVIAIVLLFSLSPIFSTIQLLEPELSAVYTPSTKYLVDLAMTKGWVLVILFIVVSAIVTWGLQIFRKEELEEEEEYEYWRRCLMDLGSAFQFLSLIASLIVGAIIYVVMSPLFQTLSSVAISLFGTDAALFPDTVVSAAYLIFKFISYSGIVFFVFLSVQFLKGFLQPWTSEY